MNELRHLFLEYGLFLAKTLTFLLALILLLGSMRRRDAAGDGWIEVRSLNKRHRAMTEALRNNLAPSRWWQRRPRFKRKPSHSPTGKLPTNGRLYVLSFHGDLHASAVHALREELNAVLSVATSGDEIAIRLESPGGLVSAYGLAASQLHRVRQAGIPLTVLIDEVAASGGYLMAAVADRIVAAPFAVVGSIGVVSALPNLNRWLKEQHIDYELHTSARFKRTLTLFGENTEEGRQKFQEDIMAIHRHMVTFIQQHRPQLDMQQVATGEHWLAQEAKELGLVDQLATSDDYLLSRCQLMEGYAIRYRTHTSWLDAWRHALPFLHARWNRTGFEQMVPRRGLEPPRSFPH